MSSYISPAKVNLFFRVLKKRADHYHEVASLYSAIGIYDRIEIVESESDFFWCSDSTIPTDASNRVIKALHLFREKTEIFKPVSIDLVKAIPIKAGLGGGSSNAATTLYALNQLFGQPLTLRELALLGAKIGSDEAFFFSSGLALGEGRGEILQDIEIPLQHKLIIAMPDEFGLETPQVYRSCLPNEVSNVDPLKLVELFTRDFRYACNDLEPAAFRVLPELKQCKAELLELGFDHVVMTGSGSAFVCYGDVPAPVLPGITFYSVSPLKRSKGAWYEVPAALKTLI